MFEHAVLSTPPVVVRDTCLQRVSIETQLARAELECNEANATLAKIINSQEMNRVKSYIT